MSETQLFKEAEVKSFSNELQLMTSPRNMSLNQAIEIGRSKDYSERAIRKVLLNPLDIKFREKYTEGEIDAALEVNIDLFSTLPKQFERIEGGVDQAIKLFNNVRTELAKFNKGKSLVEIQKKALSLLKNDSIFKSQQDQLQMHFDL